MIIFDLCNQHTVEKSTMAKRRNVQGSFGKRVRDEREEMQLTQTDMIRLLNERYGIQMSEAAFSKIEIGETKRLHIDLQMAIAGILGADIRYLLTGEEVGAITSYSEEGEIVARLIDQMQPPNRKMMVETAKAVLEAQQLLLQQAEQQAEQQLFENEREMARLMKSYINYMENGDRKWVDAYIERTDQRKPAQ